MYTGAYNISSTVGADAPRVSIASKTAPDKNIDRAPGPGNYFIHAHTVHNNAAAYTQFAIFLSV